MVGRGDPGRRTEVTLRGGVLFGAGSHDDKMETTVTRAALRRRGVAIGIATILAVAALVPASVSADRSSAPPAASSVHHGARPTDETTKGHGQDHDGSGCASSSESGEGAVHCGAARKPPTTNGTAPVPTANAANGSKAGQRPAQLSAGTSPSRTAKVSRSPASATVLPVAAPGVAAGAPSTSTPSGAGGGGSAIAHAAGAPAAHVPALRLPVSSQPTVLGPVPVVVPAIGGVASPAGGALPWTWFLALAVLDLALMVGILIRRRRRGRGDGPGIR